jgi:hypothetical protein
MADMARDVFTTIRYDGSDLSGHEIDVQELAPALLALAEMVQFTNRKFNGTDTSMKVLVKADIEQRCFQLQIHIVQSLLDAARHLFTTEQYKTAKEIAEMLDLIIPGGTLGGGVFWAWKRIWGTKEEQEKPLSSYEVEQSGGITVINNFYGDGANLQMSTSTYELATEPEMIRLGKRVLKPLERDGYSSMGFYQDEQPVVEYDNTEAARVTRRAPDEREKASENLEAIPDEIGLQQVDGQVEIVTAQYVGNAQWGLRWIGKIRQMKMADEAWLASYQADTEPAAIPGAWLDVHMEIEQVDGGASASYTVTKVKRVIPPERQTGFFDGKPSPSPK